MLRDLQIRTKLIGGYAVVALVAVAIGITGIVCQNSLENGTVTLYQNSTVPTGQLITMTATLQGMRLASRDIILNPDKQKYSARVGELKAELAKESDQFDKTIVTEATRKDFLEFKENQQKYEPYLDQIVARGGGVRTAAAKPVRQVEGIAGEAPAPAGPAAAPLKAMAAKAGVSLRLNDGRDDLDKDFVRF